MKPVLMFLGLCTSLNFCHAQDTYNPTLPVPVVEMFTLLYPDARNIEWSIAEGHYKAIFKNNRMATMATIDPEGKLMLTTTQIKVSALPETTREFLAEKGSDEKIDMALIAEDEKGVITFSAVIGKTEYSFDASGQLIHAPGLVIHSGTKDE